MHAEIVADEAVDLLALWRELADDPDSLDRYELTEHGEVVLSPRPAPRHQLVASFIAAKLREQLGDFVACDLPVHTSTAGIRVPDVAWLPKERLTETPLSDPLQKLPPVLVEVLSPGNRDAAMARKIQAYLRDGVQEVLVVGLDGSVTFYRVDGVHKESALGIKLELPPELFR